MRGQEDLRTRWPDESQCKSANRSEAPVQRCKSECGEAARGHVGMVIRGHGVMTPFRVAGGGLRWRVAGGKHLRVSGDRESGTGLQLRVRA